MVRNSLSYGAERGDSGGPVFSVRSDGRVTAKGVIVGAGPLGIVYFAPFSTAVSKWGVAPVTF